MLRSLRVRLLLMLAAVVLVALGTVALVVRDATAREFEWYVERNVDVHITGLRRKLEAEIGKGKLIKTIYGLGYKLEPDLRLADPVAQH